MRKNKYEGKKIYLIGHTVFLIWLIYKFLYVFINLDKVSDYLSTANSWIGYGRIYFVFVLCIVYFSGRLKPAHYMISAALEYVIHSIGILILVSCNTTLTLSKCIYVLESVFVYVTIPAIFAIIMALVIRKIKNDLVSVCILMLVGLLFTYNIIQAILQVPGSVVNAEICTQVCSFFQLFNHSLTTTFVKPCIFDPFPVTVNAVAVNISWVLLALVLYFAGRIKWKSIILIVMYFAVVVIAVLPENKYYVYLNNSFLLQEKKVNDSVLTDAQYYSDNAHTQQKEAAFFQIIDYDMVIKAGSTSHFTTTITLADNELTEYTFSLYHGYKVKSVTDETGNAVEFVQNGDELVIKYPQGNLKKATLKYSGATNKYMAGTIYTCLPAYYMYYPVAGQKTLYFMESGEFSKDLEMQECSFRVKVEADYKVYASLDETAYNEFSGVSEGITLIGGKYVGSLEKDNTQYVYSHWTETPETAEENFALLLNDVPQIEGMSVFISPYFSGTLFNYYIGEDYVFGNYSDLLNGLSLYYNYYKE